jgi:hypothetical protein
VTVVLPPKLPRVCVERVGVVEGEVLGLDVVSKYSFLAGRAGRVPE